MGKYKKVYKCADGKNPFFAYQPHYKKYKIVDTISALKKLARKMEHIEEFAFDTETNTLREFSAPIKTLVVCVSLFHGASTIITISLWDTVDTKTSTGTFLQRKSVNITVLSLSDPTLDLWDRTLSLTFMFSLVSVFTRLPLIFGTL